ncbi:alpha/beta fold hydrolase [Roseicitreum antarcticum]|uniref:Pimeloyl-ACP methyl ester carboxylesterase n=1 Tax=Roseicitreum antarcticum TaxID=564137 RepID=A0A1H2ULC5_9RHOB|nr:alpha/beta fold hydrolase [Roseicitreum antarcticum]SDW56932.1 Pimeloyl-ACP methyl ester carboxylesterase [Roseicitreum antarcticum]
MAEFLLIHGSCHGAWCWRDVLPHLHALGHGARAIDLPAHGADTTPLEDVTLDLYARAIVAAMETAPAPVVLVGHSMAGYPISAAAELAPALIQKLVYLCAYVPVSGHSLVQMRQAAPAQPLLEAIRKTPDGLAFTIDPAQAEAKFYHDCPPEAVAYAIARLGPQPILPQATPLRLGAAYASVPRHYIRCTDDRTIPPEYQVTMTRDWPQEDVSALDTSHSPFFTAPQALADRLIACAAG